MSPNEAKVVSCMSNMEYRSISQIAQIAELPLREVKNILVNLYNRGLVESKTTNLTLTYRIK